MEVEEEAKINNVEYFKNDWSCLGLFLEEACLQERRGIPNLTEEVTYFQFCFELQKK